MLTVSLPPSPLKILCLGAHCDDIEIGAGATLLSLLDKHRGSQVLWTVFSGDACRHAEARASAEQCLQAAGSSEIRLLRFPESCFPDVRNGLRDAFEAIKTEFEPDLIFTHFKQDDHQDHRLIADLTWSTFRHHLVLEYEIPKFEDDLGKPSVYQIVSADNAERKVRSIIEFFPSQAKRSWFSEDTFRALLRLRGIQCASPTGFAEAFHARKLSLG